MIGPWGLGMPAEIPATDIEDGHLGLWQALPTYRGGLRTPVPLADRGQALEPWQRLLEVGTRLTVVGMFTRRNEEDPVFRIEEGPLRGRYLTITTTPHVMSPTYAAGWFIAPLDHPLAGDWDALDRIIADINAFLDTPHIRWLSTALWSPPS